MPTTTNYIWDEDNLLAEADGSNTIQTVYTNEPQQYGNLVSTRLPVAGTPTTVYHHFDAIASTRQLTNAAGATTDTMVYDAWGIVVTRTGTTAIAFRWIGEVQYYVDLEVGKIYVRARVYDGSAARWTVIDPIQHSDGTSKYAYVLNNPTAHRDPSGRNRPTFENTCSADDQKCIQDALKLASDILKERPECVGGTLCQGGKRSSCDTLDLASCILEAFNRATFSCADRGVGGCHPKPANNAGHTDTACGTLKSLVSVGIIAVVPIPDVPLVIQCNPCKSPFPFANDCSACPEDPTLVVTLCNDRAPDGKTIASYCDKGDTKGLAALLVHEASHTCVGGHWTTGGNPGGMPTCDKCLRPDSSSIEAEFRKCL
jgi:RHS repeat-associated protein